MAAPDLVNDKRNKTIVKTSVITIIANIFLAGFKAAIGIITKSISVTLDAVNNLSDALSSIITIIGTKLAIKQPDKKHPLGYGRIEYLSAMIVAGLVLYAGITSSVESIKKIIHPAKPSYTTMSIIILAVFVVVKLILSRYVVSKGKQVNSMSLVASGKDAGFDAILSTSVLLSIIIYMIWGLNIEAYIGLLISIFIIKAGIEMMTDTLDELLGKRTDSEYSRKIKKTITEDPDILGAYDLVLDSFGPERQLGSVHVEINDTMTAKEIDAMQRRVAGRIYNEYGILLAGIGIYAKNTQDPEITEMRSKVASITKQYDEILQMHAFFADREKKIMAFDLIISFDTENREELVSNIQKEVLKIFPDYTVQITMDIDL